MAKHKLKRPIFGIDQLSDETSLISDSRAGTTAIREGVNIDIDTEGNVNRRKGYDMKLTGAGYHSLYESTRGWLMLCHKEELGIYNEATEVFTVLTSMDESQLTSFTELNGNLYYVNPGSKGMVRKGENMVRTLGVPLPNITPSFAAVASGGLQAGRYGISYTIVDDIGEESPLGPLVVVTLTEQSSIQCSMFTLYPNTKYRIYMTMTDGEELYQAAEFDANVTSFLLSEHGEGRRPDTQYLSPLPFGYIVRAHGSRIYIATNDFVFYSEPFQPHLLNAAHGFLPMTGFVSMMQPVEGGMYIGDEAGVRFYAGEDPQNFEPKDVSTEPAVFGTAVAVPGDYLPEDLDEADIAAVWLASSGYQIGLSSGKLVRPHTKQVRLPRYVQGCAAFSTQDGRKQLITPVNSNVLADASVALDSSTN
jgi:hypothetical protein